ncbi:hypothetical protein SLA2020_321350 [Shorea laevis]
MEKALSLLLERDSTPVKGWDLDTVARNWIRPVVVQKGVDPTPYLPPPTEWIPLPLPLQAPDMCPHLESDMELDRGETGLGVLGGTNFASDSVDSGMQLVSQQNVSTGKHESCSFDCSKGGGSML